MIRFFIKNGDHSLRVELPSDELFDHLGCIGIREDIPIGGTDRISVERYTVDEGAIAETVCKRLLPEDKISEVNELCKRLESACRISSSDVKTALDELDIYGVKQMIEALDCLDFQAQQSMNM